jgi:small nuclear ribonucleoprotein (snRNP)-like protein
VIVAVVVLAALAVMLAGGLTRVLTIDRQLRGQLQDETQADRLLRERLRQKVLVTLLSGEAFGGVLWEVDRQSFLLRDAKPMTDASARPVPIDGELGLPRDQIHYWQRPGETWR